MSLVPEAQIIVVNAVLLLVAYLGIYPAMRDITVGRMMAVDAVVSGLGLLVAGYLFHGTGTRFSLVLFSVNWVVFSIVAMAAMEMPLFRWFCKERGLDPFGTGDD